MGGRILPCSSSCDKDAANLVEITYEGKGPFGIQCMVECATDNTTRTVANVKSYFNKCGGSFLPIGSLEFMFTRKAVFEIEMPAGMDKDDLELELIDYGLDEITSETDEEEGIRFLLKLFRHQRQNFP